MKRIFVLFLALVMTLCLLTGCAAWNRSLKSMGSDFAGGLNRTVTAYSYDGQEIQSWSGRIDIADEAPDGEIMFDLNGKRINIINAIVIVEEQ